VLKATVQTTFPESAGVDRWLLSVHWVNRPGGEKTNIELNGQTVTMGTATWEPEEELPARLRQAPETTR
jgi:hypothetical protein